MIRDQQSLVSTSPVTKHLIDGEFCNVLHSVPSKKQAGPNSESAASPDPETASVHQSIASDSSMPILSTNLEFDHHVGSEEFPHLPKSDSSLLTQSDSEEVLANGYQVESVCPDFTLNDDADNRDFGSLLLELKER